MVLPTATRAPGRTAPGSQLTCPAGRLLAPWPRQRNAPGWERRGEAAPAPTRGREPEAAGTGAGADVPESGCRRL